MLAHASAGGVREDEVETGNAGGGVPLAIQDGSGSVSSACSAWPRS